MPYCDSKGVRIHYHVEGNPDRPPLVLHHGFSMSLQDWYDPPYVAALGGAYRLILVDPRGHGASDKPHDADAYRDRRMAADVVAVLDALGIDRAHFFGYSMGAMIGFALALHAPDRFRSLVLGAGNPTDHDPDQPEAIAAWLPDEIGTWLSTIEPWFGPRLTPALRARQLSNDAEALRSRMLGWSTERHRYEDRLADARVPCLFFAGDADQPVHDQCKAVSARMPWASFVSLPGLNHVEGVYRVDLVAPYVLAFLVAVP